MTKLIQTLFLFMHLWGLGTEARDCGCAHGSTCGLRAVWPMLNLCL